MTLVVSQTYNKATLDCKHIQNHNELPEKKAVFITLLSMKEIKVNMKAKPYMSHFGVSRYINKLRLCYISTCL